MSRRLLRAFVGAAFVGALAMPAGVTAKPPDLPEDGTITVTPQVTFTGAVPLKSSETEQKETYVLKPARIDDDPSQPAVEDNVLSDVPPKEWGWFSGGCQDIQVIMRAKYTDWFSWLLAHWTARQRPLPPEQNEGYIQRFEPQHFLSGLTPAGTLTSDLNIPIVQVATEKLPMPQEDTTTKDGVTCPYLRQKMLDHHASQFADPEIGRDVLDNLARLKEADQLLELAEVLANDGCIDEAMACCERAEELCPGSPSAARAADTKLELSLGMVRPTSESEEAAEPKTETQTYPWSTTEPGREEMVCGLMRACHLLMSQGMHHQAAELARQAFALDPQRVQADPLIYKMHLLAASPPSETNEAPEPPVCPYCGKTGKPIRAIVAEPKKSKTKTTKLCVPPLPKVDYELVPALDRILTEDAKPNAGKEEASESTTTPNDEDAIA